MNITRRDIFEAGYITSLAVYEHFGELSHELDRLCLHPGMPTDKKDTILQLSAQASSLKESQSQGVDLRSFARFTSELDPLLAWFAGLPLDDEVES
ncbi:hypothetical protein V7G11_04100 [Cutibacterium avidum]|uniref:hypothetical protein n=1 Tax=Cutibacterium avidum TaxID=33010 RepID=UPI002FF16C2A